MHFDSCWPNPSIANMNTKCVSTCVDQTNPMPVRTQNVSEHVLTQPLKCQRGHKIHLTMCCPIPSYAWEDTKCPSTCVDETRNKPARTQIKSLFEVTKTVPCQQEHKMHLNLCWPNLSHASEDISTCVDQTPLMAATRQNIPQLVLTKPRTCQRCHMHLNMCWPIPSYAIEDTKFIPACVDQTKPSQRIFKMHLKIYYPNLTHAIQDTKYISNCVDQTYPMPARTQDVSQLVLTNPLPCQRGNTMYLKII